MKNIIFDTDLGSDCDDVMALAYLRYAQKNLGANILAITHCLKTKFGLPAIKSFCRFFNMGNIPVGVMEGGADLTDQYAEKLALKFADESDYIIDGTATTVLRKALVNSSGNVVICAVGQFTNIGALLNSKPDDISELSGIELVKKYCEKIVLMAGNFTNEPDGTRGLEWNVRWDVDATKTVIEKSPVPVSFLPFEMGIRVITGSNLVEKYNEQNPLSYAFKVYPNAKMGRASWDPITAVYAVEGVKDFLIEVKGDVTVSESGQTYFTKNENGNHILLHYNYKTFETEYDACNAISNYIDALAESIIN